MAISFGVNFSDVLFFRQPISENIFLKVSVALQKKIFLRKIFF